MSHVTAGQVTFEGNAPYQLPLAQSASASPGEGYVEILLDCATPGGELPSVLVRARLPHWIASELGVQLGPVSAAARRWAEQNL